jgi:hypothetical protein
MPLITCRAAHDSPTCMHGHCAAPSRLHYRCPQVNKALRAIALVLLLPQFQNFTPKGSPTCTSKTQLNQPPHWDAAPLPQLCMPELAPPSSCADTLSRSSRPHVQLLCCCLTVMGHSRWRNPHLATVKVCFFFMHLYHEGMACLQALPHQPS